MEMKISYKKKVTVGSLNPGEIFAFGSPEIDDEIFVYMRLDEHHSCSNAVVLFPKQYQGRISSLNDLVKVIPVSGRLEVDFLPTVSDFRE